MSIQSTNLDMTILEEGDPADLTTVSDNFSAIDAVVGDIATVESSPTAAAHSTGEFLLYEGRLYKVTAEISAGASLVLGTNVAAANIGTELKSIQDSLSREYDYNNASSLNDAMQQLYNSLGTGYFSGAIGYNGVGVFQAKKWSNGTGAILVAHSIGVIRFGQASNSSALTIKNVTLT